MTVHTAYETGCRLYASGKFAEAEAAFRSCLQQHPDHPDLLNALGSAIEARGGYDEAAGYLEQACRLRPDSAPFRYNLANLLRQRGEREKAEIEYLEAIKYNPELVEAFHGLGSMYLEDGRLEPAEACLQRAVAMSPEFVPALHDLGQLCQRLGRLEEAEQLYHRSISINARFLPALNSLGMLLLKQNRLDESRSCFEQAINENPAYLQARCNLAVLDTWTGKFEPAINELQKALEIAPNDGDIHFNLSLALLSSGRMQDGWREHEWRFSKANPVALRHAGIPRWQGEPLSGKRILIHSEQGYGDSLQFIRYASLLADLGAKVFVEGQDNKISPLLATVQGVSTVLSRGETVPAVDFQVPMMSLPLPLGSLGWPPLSAPYLNPPDWKTKLWRERLSALPGLKVGLAWAGRPEHDNDANRSIPESLLSPLGSIAGVSFVSLQFGSGKIENIPFCLHDPSAGIEDFCDSAALVSQLDLVITVDSANAHLAGGLGIPFLLLLPWNPDWRWMRDRTDSIWYPTARIYRQKQPGQWEAVIEEIVSDLSAQSPYKLLV